MAKEQLSNALSERMEREKAERSYTDRSCLDHMAIRRHDNEKAASVWRPKFAEDIDRIMYSPYYNRYTDKKQYLSHIESTSSLSCTFCSKRDRWSLTSSSGSISQYSYCLATSDT